MTWQNIPGHSNDIEAFYAMLAKDETLLPHGATFLEVGVFFGRSLACIGSQRPDLDLWGIDVWEDGEAEDHYGGPAFKQYAMERGGIFPAFLRSMMEEEPYVLTRTHVLRCPSLLADPLAIAPDVVFIDANHSYDAVKADINHWLHSPRLRIIAGHDYEPVHWGGVVQAVNEAFGGRHEMGPEVGHYTSCWWVRL